MALSKGRFLPMLPGPSMVPDRVLRVMDQTSEDFYMYLNPKFQEMTHEIQRDLLLAARSEQYVAMYIGNGHVAWEASIANVMDASEKALFLSTGLWPKLWSNMAKSVGVDVEIMEFGFSASVDTALLESRLREDAAHEIKAVFCVHTDTASSIHNDIPAIRSAIDAAGHPALLLVDCIATLGCVEVEMDKWGIDVVVAGSQKGFMMPVGLCFTFFSEKALDARRRKEATVKQRVPETLDWLARWGPSKPKFWASPLIGTGTPPTHLLIGLRAALDMLLREEGLSQCWARHEAMARAVWAAVDAWGKSGHVHCHIDDVNRRSCTMTTIRIDGFKCKDLLEWCMREGNLLLASQIPLPGIPSNMVEEAFRIGHMGHMNAPMLLGALGTIDMGMTALGIPHGEGALDAAAQVLTSYSRSFARL